MATMVVAVVVMLVGRGEVRGRVRHLEGAPGCWRPAEHSTRGKFTCSRTKLPAATSLGFWVQRRRPFQVMEQGTDSLAFSCFTVSFITFLYSFFPSYRSLSLSLYFHFLSSLAFYLALLTFLLILFFFFIYFTHLFLQSSFLFSFFFLSLLFLPPFH